MPGLNRKGPENQGPRTGRGLGRCNENESIERENESLDSEERPGRGMAYRRGFGRAGGMGRGGSFGRGGGMGRGRGGGFGRRN